MAVTSVTMAPLAIISVMNVLTAARSGVRALVIGGGLSLGIDTVVAI
jgi:hypothetical protein